MKTVAIISKPSKSELQLIVPELLRWFRGKDYRVLLDEETAGYNGTNDGCAREEIGKQKPDFAVVLGGDGTLLSAARAVSRFDVPILAVNLGTLGFLTEVALSDLYPALEAVDRGGCQIESRSVIECRLVRGGKCIESYVALNDVVVNKGAIARLVGFDLFIEGRFVVAYKADGVILSTPTGSTAYSLAAGGPILAPAVDAFVITPVSPHALTHRPLVVRDSLKIEIKVQCGQEKAFLTIDGQKGMPILQEDCIECVKAAHKVKLFRTQNTFFDVLRTKLKWGQR